MKTSKLALALTTLFSSGIISAITIVTVKTETIIKESDSGIEIQENVAKEQRKLAEPFEKLEAEIKAKETRLIEKQKALAKEDENFKNQASLLSPDARAEKYEELQKKHRDLDEEVADFQRAMRKAHEDAKKVDQKLEMFYRKEMMAFEQEIKTLIEEIAKSESWDIVLAKEATIYAGPTTDKTSVVIQKLNEKKAKRDAAAKATQAIKTPAKTASVK